MIVLRSASTPCLELVGEQVSFSHTAAPYTDYSITDWNISPSALLFLIDDERLIIKLLRPYRDTRYSLEKLSERQQCLLEALKRNRAFTPELYVGLAPLHSLNLSQKIIRIGEVVEDPSESSLDANKEYTLLMKAQHQETGLDYVLANGEIESLMPLVEYVADIHNHKDKVLDLPLEECIRWGNYDYLLHKLGHNLEFLDFLINSCNESGWDDREDLKERVTQVKTKAQEVAKQECYRRYFDQRANQGYIKLCHGDIKSPHIWIASEGSKSDQKWSFYLLDAIDFNPMYNHIDLLSDFALLLADVQAHSPSPVPLKEMVDCYLQQTDQDNEVARRVLDYYVMEKAIVGASISFLYDSKPQLGRAFLKVAEHSLKSMQVAVPA